MQVEFLWNSKLFQEQKYLVIMSYYFILVMASSQLNTLSCRWDSCYGWGWYLRFLFDQLQTFRFWAMSRDLSFDLKCSHDQMIKRRCKGMKYSWFCYCWIWYSYNTSWLQYYWYSIIWFPSWLQTINDQTFHFLFQKFWSLNVVYGASTIMPNWSATQSKYLLTFKDKD